MTLALERLPLGAVASCWGAGFVAMDVVDVDGEPFAAAGGSCGNVMAILAWLGWGARMVARLGDDPAGRFIREELRRLGVDLTHVTAESGVRSPIVLQRFATAKDGTRTHRFSLTCPGCGRWLPRHRPITLAQSESLAYADDAPSVFYFDRVSPASLRLAEETRDRGALVVFEPSSVADESKFQRAVDSCHVLKYSQERLGHLPDLPFAAAPALVVETQAAAGLRYRWLGRWWQFDAVPIADVVDAAGSGDWCTAVLIHRLGRNGATAMLAARHETIGKTLREAQAVAAVNCGFVGARGAMQALALGDFNETLGTLGRGASGTCARRDEDAPKTAGPSLNYCEQCDAEVVGVALAGRRAG